MSKKRELRKLIREEVEDQLKDIELEPSDETAEEYARNRNELEKVKEFRDGAQRFQKYVQDGVNKLNDKIDQIENAPFLSELDEVETELEEFIQKVEALTMAAEQNIYERKGRPMDSDSYRAKSPHYGSTAYY